MTTWTRGTIVVSRQDLSKKSAAAKGFIGYCPPKNVLYPLLTVEETLHFYVQLKTLLNRIEAWDEVERFVGFAMLHDYRYNLVTELTPSSQRVLMIACAFIGGSRVRNFCYVYDEFHLRMPSVESYLTILAETAGGPVG
jgi:ABC-type multidrug transport system ATPase subunit